MTLIVQSHVTNLTPGMERSTLASAGRSAETNGDRMARGLPGRCVRGRFKHPIRPESCAAEYLLGEPDCVRDNGCTTGRIMAARYKGEVMARNLGFCTGPDCPSKGEEVLIKCAGMCATCYRMDLAARKGKKPAPKESPILAPEESAALDKAMAHRSQEVTCHDPAAEAAARASNPVEIPVTMATVREIVADEIDESRRFTLAGIEFEPLRKHRIPGENRVSVRSTSIGISSAAYQAHGLDRYTHARYTVSVDGKSLALKFFDGPKGDAVKIDRHKGGVSLSAVPLVRAYPHLVGKRAALESTDMAGWYVARFGGEVAA